jgi:hypothetical protein
MARVIQKFFRMDVIFVKDIKIGVSHPLNFKTGSADV